MCAAGLLIQSEYKWVKIYAVLFAMLEITTIIVLKGHYFMDIYAAIATYLAVR